MPKFSEISQCRTEPAISNPRSNRAIFSLYGEPLLEAAQARFYFNDEAPMGAAFARSRARTSSVFADHSSN